MSTQSKRLEIWGGVECTVNRVGDEYYEQLDRSHHASHVEDLDRFAELGISALRQPVLWEKTAPDSIADADWTWPDRCLLKLRDLRIRPIAGLLHHGSGPRYTSLIDPQFPEKLAEYARAVAERYPWVEDYTPVNEPLTTARFSGLYGFWYPHGRDELTFATVLLNECRGTVLAMRAIRSVNPRARLIQTDDLGKAFSTPALRYQADFENERRWCAWDLLSGRLTPDTVLWQRFENIGVDRSELEWFLDNPCTPDIIGVNHYLSGERFLDENVERYPGEPVGGNGRDRYVDVLAARVRAEGASGFHSILSEAWNRYHIPIALTEVHNGCTREEQLRWLAEAWDSSTRIQNEGVDIRALTAWSLIGAFDWDSLVTRKENHYEPGAYDLRAPKPRETAIAKMVRELARTGVAEHPVLASQGWWKTPRRFIYGHALTDEGVLLRPRRESRLRIANSTRPLMIIGAGTLGRALKRACVVRGLDFVILTREEIDIVDAASIRRVLEGSRPWAVINATGFSNIDEAETNVYRSFRENAIGAQSLAIESARIGSRYATYSSDMVFDGAKQSPYIESDMLSPLNVYGRSKAAAEREVLASHPEAMILRSGEFFSPWDRHNFVFRVLQSAAAGESFIAAEDTFVSPTYVPDLAEATLDLLIDSETGIWNLANAVEVTWFGFAARVLERGQYASSMLKRAPTRDLALRAPRPQWSVLGSERSSIMPSLDDAIERFFRDCELLKELQREKSEAA